MGWVSDLVGSFTGKSAKEATARSRTDSTAALDQGFKQAKPLYDQAAGVYDPFMQTEIDANKAYGNALGLYGADAARGAYEGYASNPGFMAAAERGLKKTKWGTNARGMADSGAGYAALADAGLSYYDDYLGRLKGVGMGATAGKSNALQAGGNLRYKYGADRASNALSLGQQEASDASLFGQNVLGLTSAAVTGGTTAYDIYKNWNK
jgi:hypothetical protein